MAPLLSFNIACTSWISNNHFLKRPLAIGTKTIYTKTTQTTEQADHTEVLSQLLSVSHKSITNMLLFKIYPATWPSYQQSDVC